MSRLVSIIGDGNVRRNMTGLNIASREAMKTAQVVACDDLVSLDGALLAVRPESAICIVAATTEPLVSAQRDGTLFATVDPILSELVTKLSTFCLSRPALQLLVAPLSVPAQACLVQ